jgi:hypothetical protein
MYVTNQLLTFLFYGLNSRFHFIFGVLGFKRFVPGLSQFGIYIYSLKGNGNFLQALFFIQLFYINPIYTINFLIMQDLSTS